VNVVEPVPEPVKEQAPSAEAKIWLETPSLHWSDVMIKVNRSNLVDLEDQVLAKLTNVDKRASN